jgi:hypothetical protein
VPPICASAPCLSPSHPSRLHPPNCHCCPWPCQCRAVLYVVAVERQQTSGEQVSQRDPLVHPLPPAVPAVAPLALLTHGHDPVRQVPTDGASSNSTGLVDARA